MKKTALITGASSGIGESLARIHAKANGDLILVARSGDKLNTLKAELEQQHGITVTVITQDLSQANAAQSIYDTVKAQQLRVDYLINNAGFGGLGEFHKRHWQYEAQMIQVNITALTQLTHLFLPDLIAQGSGKVLNVSSIASLVPGPLQAVYYATKAYVTSFSNAIASELEGTGVTVTALLPGATKTGFGAKSGMDKTAFFDKTANADDVAQAGYDGMLAGHMNVISGLTLSQKVLLRIAPFVPKKMLLKQIKSGQTVKQ